MNSNIPAEFELSPGQLTQQRGDNLKIGECLNEPQHGSQRFL